MAKLPSNKIPELHQPFWFEEYHYASGGTFEESRLAMFWGIDEESGIRAMKYLDEEKGMKLINPLTAHKYQLVEKH